MLGLTRHAVRQFARAAAPGQMIVGPRPRSSGQDHRRRPAASAGTRAAPTVPGKSSGGIAEGTIRRVKALTRQMSGRANLDLLRKRILLSA